VRSVKIFFSSVIFFFSIFSANAQLFDFSGKEIAKNFHLSVEPTFSYTAGHLGEILYYSAPSDKKISYLEWDRNVFLFGTRLLTSYKNLHLDFSFSSSLFEQTAGTMEDSDWLNTNDYSMKTTFSVGDNEAVENYEADFKIYYDFKTSDWLTFSPIVSVRYNYDSFERRRAEGWYGDYKHSADGKNHWWYDDEYATHFPYTYYSDEKGRYVTRKLAGIDFFRHSLFTFFGFNTKISPSSRLIFDFCFLISPFSYFYAIDSHHAQDSSTKEMYKKHYRMIQFSYFNLLSIGTGAFFSVTKIFEISLRANYLFTFEIERGTLFSDTFDGAKQDNYYNTGQDSGVEFENFTVTLGLKVKIF